MTLFIDTEVNRTFLVGSIGGNVFEIRRASNREVVGIMRQVHDGFRTSNRWGEFQTFAHSQDAVAFATEGR